MSPEINALIKEGHVAEPETHVSLLHITGIPDSCMAWPARLICSEPTVASNTLNSACLKNSMESQKFEVSVPL